MSDIQVGVLGQSHPTSPIYTEAIVAVYPSQSTAEDAVRSLTAAGVASSDLSVIGTTAQERMAAQDGSFALPAVLSEELDHRDVVKGAWVGGAFGTLLGLEVALLEGIGGIIVLGPLAAGALYFGFLGILIGSETHHQEEASAEYRIYLHEGKILVVVHTRDRAETEHVRTLVRATQPLQVEKYPYHMQRSNEKLHK